MSDELLHVVNKMISADKKSRREISDIIGMNYSTLKRELNPNDTGAKLGVVALIHIMQACGSIEPLEYIASQVGCSVRCLDPIIPDKPTLEAECLDTYPSLVEFHNAIKERLPLGEVQVYFDKLVREIEEDLVKYKSECS